MKNYAHVSSGIVMQMLTVDDDVAGWLREQHPEDIFVETAFFGDADAFTHEEGVIIKRQRLPLYTVPQIIDMRTLEQLKDAQWVKMKQARRQAEYAGFVWDGSVFDSDATSQLRITGAVTLAQMDDTLSIGWTLKNNIVRTLNASELKAVGAALGLHVATQFARGQYLRLQIEGAQNAGEVAAVVW